MNRSLEDKVRHWWPGYWYGLIEGLILGAVSVGLAWAAFALR